MSNFRIESDGTVAGTKVIDSLSGKSVGYIQKITWEASLIEHATKCTIEMIGIPVNVNIDMKNIIFKSLDDIAPIPTESRIEKIDK